MGEYAKNQQGERIKIGTCESMYYLRADQAHEVRAESGNVDPVRDRFDGIRFRFPFPDEDALAPGHFEDYDRGVRIPGWSLPSEWGDHGSIQFVAREAGYLVSLPCPEQFGSPGMSADVRIGAERLTVHRNGFSGYPVVRQQRWLEADEDGPERLVTVVSCGACGAAWRLHTAADAASVVEAFLNEAEREEYRHELGGFGPAHEGDSKRFLVKMAERIMDGYTVVGGAELAPEGDRSEGLSPRG